jgi:glycosyltransferase involved in cell wall biosynthesis
MPATRTTPFPNGLLAMDLSRRQEGAKMMALPGSTLPRRVLILARGGTIYGSQRQLGYLVGGLDRSRFEPIVVLDRPGPTADFLRQGGAEVQIISMRPWRSFPAGLLRYVDALRIVRIGRRHGVSLVHASDSFRSGYLHFASKRLRVPSVVHVRGRVPPSRIEGHALARASAIVVIARRYQEDLLGAGIPPRQVELIDDAVDLDQFHPGLPGRAYLRQRLGIGDGVLVGLVGRIEPSKRVREFLQALAPLARDRDHRVTYLVVGQAKDEAYGRSAREEALRLGLQGRVIFTGHLGEMPLVMAGLDVLVTLSGGSVMFEAMACAKPVLSVRVDGRHSEHTRHGETAWCVTTDRPEPVWAALAKLIEDEPMRTRLGLAGRAWAEQHLSPAGLVARTQALYERLVGG